MSKSHPAIFGIGIYELKESFPSDSEFQKSILERFFSKQLNLNLSFMKYSRNVPTILSKCNLSPTGDSSLSYLSFSQELNGVDQSTGKLITFAVLQGNYFPLPTSQMIQTQIKGDVAIFSYSKTHFLISGYPSEEELYSNPSYNLSIFKQGYETDKKLRWIFYKGNLLCAQVNTPSEEDKLIEVLKTFNLSNQTNLDVGSWQNTATNTSVNKQEVVSTLCKNSKIYNKINEALIDSQNVCFLDLSAQKLTILPSTIGNFPNLTDLALHLNQITNLPPEIGKLTQLKTLHLGNNRLTQLPAEIGNLKQLTTLELGNNQLTSVPTEIGNLTSLTTLYLNGNKISSLPDSISQLKNLKQLHLEGNPISEEEKQKLKTLLPDTQVSF